jgi:protein-S-isoprenylcysteine O-methyltransferase Ste14
MKMMPTTCLLIAILVGVAFHVLLPVAHVLRVPWNLFGLIPLLFGVWINVSADMAFKQAGTTVKPFEESKALVQEGVFRRSRNPMYLGFVGILLGVATLLRSLSPFLVVVSFAILIDRVYIQVEERMLEAQFGDEWRRYRASVRAWL